LNKLSVIGTKDFNNYELLYQELEKEQIDVLVIGGKKGPDLMAEDYALNKGIPTQVFLPDYQRFGRSANYERNLEMIRNSTRILVFWNERSRSPFNYLPYIRKCKCSFKSVIY
jgi:hypothetical protein